MDIGGISCFIDKINKSDFIKGSCDGGGDFSVRFRVFDKSDLKSIEQVYLDAVEKLPKLINLYPPEAICHAYKAFSLGRSSVLHLGARNFLPVREISGLRGGTFFNAERIEIHREYLTLSEVIELHRWMNAHESSESMIKLYEGNLAVEKKAFVENNLLCQPTIEKPVVMYIDFNHWQTYALAVKNQGCGELILNSMSSISDKSLLEKGFVYFQK